MSINIYKAKDRMEIEYNEHGEIIKEFSRVDYYADSKRLITFTGSRKLLKSKIKSLKNLGGEYESKKVLSFDKSYTNEDVNYAKELLEIEYEKAQKYYTYKGKFSELLKDFPEIKGMAGEIRHICHALNITILKCDSRTETFEELSDKEYAFQYPNYNLKLYKKIIRKYLGEEFLY